MIGFEHVSSGIGSNRAVNCATQTAPPNKNYVYNNNNNIERDITSFEKY